MEPLYSQGTQVLIVMLTLSTRLQSNMWPICQNKYLFGGRSPVESHSVCKLPEKVDERRRSATCAEDNNNKLWLHGNDYTSAKTVRKQCAAFYILIFRAQIHPVIHVPQRGHEVLVLRERKPRWRFMVRPSVFSVKSGDCTLHVLASWRWSFGNFNMSPNSAARLLSTLIFSFLCCCCCFTCLLPWNQTHWLFASWALPIITIISSGLGLNPPPPTRQASFISHKTTSQTTGWWFLVISQQAN